jgi:hemoglobin
LERTPGTFGVTIAAMKKILLPFLAFGIVTATAAEPAAPGAASATVSKSASSKFSTEYEGRTYTFPDDAALAKWKADREASLYQQIGGKAAMDAAIEIFYKKVLADNRIKHFFDDVDMVRQRTKQKQFLSAALGGPIPWEGKDMRKAHAKLPGLNESHFNAVAENLQATLSELKVKKELIEKVMAVAASTRADVLNLPK